MLNSRMSITVHIITILFLVLTAVGCIPAITVPIETVRYNDNAGSARILMVYLPGRGDPVTAAGKNGLVAAVRKRGLPVDVIGVNAHIGYYLNGTVFTRIQDDVISPAENRGIYEQIWLIGNSLGGYGSLSFASMHPEEITGVVLLGPYLGREEVVEEIKHAGGIKDWEPKTIKMHTEDQWDKGLWLYMKARVEGRSSSEKADCAENRSCSPVIYLGYGRDDRYSPRQAYLASLLPPDRVIAIDGGHDWDTWEKLWNMFLDRHIFGRNHN